MKIAIIFGLLLSFSAYANSTCSGWHEFQIVEEDDMQFLDDYLGHFQPNLNCTQPLKKDDAITAAKKIIAEYKKCAQCDEPDVDYMTKITKGTYQLCTSETMVSGRSDTYTNITFIRPYLNNGYNITFMKKAYE